MRYLLLIYEEPPTAELDPAYMQQVMQEYNEYSAWLRETGQFLGGEALQPVTTATTVQVRDGKTLTTDGPFAETKEFLGGFYLIEARDLDAALEAAARLPSAKWGKIEVRPIWEEPANADAAAAELSAAMSRGPG
ncbi:MAG: YciI family protein [Chloroflexota bacterium]